MKILLVTPPTIEPVTKTELLLHLRQDSDDITTALTTAQSILPGSHAIADNYTTHVGASVSVLGKTAIVNLNAGTVGALSAELISTDTNRDFETSIGDWTDRASGTLTDKYDSDAHSGSSCLRFQQTGVGSRAGNCTYLAESFTGVSAPLIGKKFEYVLYLKSVSGNTSITLEANSGTQQATATISDSSWTEVRFPFYNFSGPVNALYIWAADTATFLIDDVSNHRIATLDAKIQESNDNTTWTDWTGGAFTQVTAANDNAIQEKQYTGSMAYIRVVAKVLTAACEFGADILTISHENVEDNWLTDAIQAAREDVEDITRRALLTQTWYYYLDKFPDKDHIVIPFGNLQSVTSIKYKNSDGTETVMTVTTDYIVEINGTGCGRIVLPYGVSWPSFTPYPSNPITIEFVCGWTAAASIPKKIKQACLMICANLYANRGEQVIGQSVAEDKTADRLLASYRLWEEFE